MAMNVKTKRILKISGLLLLAGFSLFLWQKKKRNSARPQFRSVNVERGGIRITVQATGTVMPRNRLELKPPIAGRIEAIRVQEGQRVKKGEVLAWLSSTERAALLDAARAKGEAEAAYWEEAYKPTPLVSPMDGVIIARNMEPGQTVTTQDAPLVMSDRLIVKAQVDETDIGRLQLGLGVEVTLDAYPGKKIPGRTSHIAYESKTVNNVTIYEVDVLPETVPPFMRSGMTANLTFLVREKKDVLLLPEEAVRMQDGEAEVLVSAGEGNGKARRRPRPVKTGLSDGKHVEVTEGLAEGDVVFVPVVKLGEGAQGGSNPFMPFGGRRPPGTSRSGGQAGSSRR